MHSHLTGTQALPINWHCFRLVTRNRGLSRETHSDNAVIARERESVDNDGMPGVCKASIDLQLTFFLRIRSLCAVMVDRWRMGACCHEAVAKFTHQHTIYIRYVCLFGVSVSRGDGMWAYGFATHHRHEKCVFKVWRF